VPLFKPSQNDVREMLDGMARHTKIEAHADGCTGFTHCHHEKTIVIDDRLAFVGGIDLTAESGDRFDSVAHVARGHLGWHDVASLVRGPAVADVAEHFRMRWHEVTGKTIPPVGGVEETGDLDVQIIRTIPEHIYSAVPRGEFGILESYVRALRSARRLIYLENQFLWSPEITAIVADKLRRPPDDRFRVLIVLPSKPNTGADDTRGSLGALIEADNGAGRLLACTLYAHEGAFSDPIYVHAKVAIVDDHWLTIGSANLNDHSLFNDTEMNVVIRDDELATNTRHRLWAEHLELPISAIAGEPANVIDTLWKPISAHQLDHLSTGRPLTRRPVRLPNLSRSSERLLGPLQGLLVDG
jgi:phosphatidylserine/phosphatidylglycerophosphate/cardiolipin synthase-like enzyme